MLPLVRGSEGKLCAFKDQQEYSLQLGLDRGKLSYWPQAGVRVKVTPSQGRVLRTACLQKRSFEGERTE